ncbi:MAG TPA: phosphatase PAP2 family protein [Streptosporangiaceae bacterium]|nr:phosphatase PAP2 family protein [Streptosporangiaceae bacterium]
MLLVIVFYGAYTITRLILSPTGTGPAFAHATDILSLERTLGFDIELGLNRALVGLPWLARAANLFYATAHFAVTLTVLVWLYRRRPAHYLRLRTALMAATAAALAGFWLYPLAPPRLIGHGYIDPVTALHTFGLYSGHTSGELTNQFAAMPSMHAGWALWCGFVLLRLGRPAWLRVLGAVYPLVTLLVILGTANHYLLDAVIGALIVVVSLAASWRLHRHLILKKESGLIHEVGHKLTTPTSIGDMPNAGV